MNRTARLRVVVDELTRAAPGACTASELARRCAVSSRTIVRDVAALQASGVPVRAQTGPGGGYVLDPCILQPVALTPPEAVAVAAALIPLPSDAPHGHPVRSAYAKLWEVLPDDARHHLPTPPRPLPSGTDA